MRRLALFALFATALAGPIAVAMEPTTAPNTDPTKLEVFPQQEYFGYRHADGTVVIPPQFLSAQPFTTEGLACVAKANVGWLWIRPDQSVVAQAFNFDNDCDPFSEDKPHLARFVAVDASGVQKIGFIDRKGQIVIPAQLDGAFPFEQGKATVCIGCRLEALEGDVDHRRWIGGRWGEINPKGVVTLRETPGFTAPTPNPLPRP